MIYRGYRSARKQFTSFVVVECKRW